MPQVREGDKIPLSFQLYDGATDKYIRVILRKPDGTELGDSPVDLTHIGEGMYTDNSVDMPLLDYVTGSYKTYSDSGYTTEDTNYEQSEELYILSVPVAELVEVLNKINDILTNGVITKGFGYDIKGRIDAQEITSKIEDNEIVAKIEEDAIQAKIEDDNIKGIIEQDEIEGEI